MLLVGGPLVPTRSEAHREGVYRDRERRYNRGFEAFARIARPCPSHDVEWLGLLGTITGLIRSFSFLGNEELAVQAVTGGIAEALIATACGLGIAIFSLIPFNFFTSRVSNLEFELQTAATNLEVMLEAQQKEPREHRGVEIERGTPASATRSSI
jgi:biopolymer transport protein ExbB/TolQ